jgi:hypothetical protein
VGLSAPDAEFARPASAKAEATGATTSEAAATDPEQEPAEAEAAAADPELEAAEPETKAGDFESLSVGASINIQSRKFQSSMAEIFIPYLRIPNIHWFSRIFDIECRQQEILILLEVAAAKRKNTLVMHWVLPGELQSVLCVL